MQCFSGVVISAKGSIAAAHYEVAKQLLICHSQEDMSAEERWKWDKIYHKFQNA